MKEIKDKAIHIKAENFEGCMTFLAELGKMLTEKAITRATLERSPGGIIRIVTYRRCVTTTPAGKSILSEIGSDETGQYSTSSRGCRKEGEDEGKTGTVGRCEDKDIRADCRGIH